MDAGEAESVRIDDVGKILAAADERDAISDARDAAAEERERELDLAEMRDVEGTYGDHWAERRHASLDRMHAMADRAASRQDRITLAWVLAGQQSPRS